MSVFNELIRKKGQAEEDLFFAKLDLELIAELHKRLEQEHQTADPIFSESDLEP